MTWRHHLQVPPEVTDEEAVLLGDILRYVGAHRGGSIFSWSCMGGCCRGATCTRAEAHLVSWACTPANWPASIAYTAVSAYYGAPACCCATCSTAFFCAEQGGVGPDTSVAVIGCGPVGLLAVMAAQHLGAKQVRSAYTPLCVCVV
jgi:hypothetical protein